MPGWFSRSVRGVKSLSSRTPSAFELSCACGESVAGVRTGKYQVVNCPACARALFVFPESVYPPLKDKRRKSGAQETKQSPRAPDKGSAGRAATTAAKGTTPDPSPSEAPAEVPQRPRPPLLTPVRAVAAALILTVSLTGLGIWHMRARDAAQQVLTQAPERAHDALRSGDVRAAATEFAKAAEAVDILRRRDPPAQALRQLARETDAATRLALQGPFEIVTEAIEATESSEHDWSGAFRAAYRGGWLLVDAQVPRPPGKKEAERLELTLPLLIRGLHVRLAADFRGLVPLWGEAETRRVIFAARLEECRPFLGDNPGWELLLAPKSTLLWANAETLRALGFDVDESTEAVLAQQAEHLGVAQ